ncbi:thioredoxin fold domain-containing protein [Roseiconus nitratireducens]|uniref:Thioredoxin fold domain-containing protein n=1 Tax=Roseiconus nitratireducens TaxID=2605748 RepID=A0A5M6D0C7_9BACT|nr:trypsin-like peptidase domain-containing protein [Roseiconus nitratireducens]KAA5540938.1 thioredoxin fold domain-containing protein [Roseiconus nitratireducens]
MFTRGGDGAASLRPGAKLVFALVLSLAALCSGTASAAGAMLLAFSSAHCGPCQAMQPVLDRLAANGVPIREVDVNRETEFARRYGIRQTPTFVVLSGGRELTRLVGIQSEQELRTALAISPTGPLVRTGANFPGDTSLNAPQTRLVPPHSAIPPASHRAATDQIAPSHGEPMPSLSLAESVERAQAATVRLRVHDGHGFGVGTGTIIDRHGDEALVLTCGHLFRETKLESNVEVDLFVGGNVKTVPGKVVDYDAEDRDIALVVIRPGFDITPVAILPSSQKPENGQSVFSFGCDRGDDPSRRDTRITGVNKYNQHIKASNIEIAGAPIDGRSGGGLFDHSGKLIGVCNAADYDGDVGIYTGPGSIQWQLDRVQLSHLYQGVPGGPAANIAAQPATSDPRVAIAPASFDQPVAPAQPGPAAASAVRPAGHQAPAVSSAAPGQEVIIIVRDPNNPAADRVVTLEHPTKELMELIHRQAR